jgi:hypothetical protein
VTLKWVDGLVATNDSKRAAALVRFRRGEQAWADYGARAQQLGNELGGGDPDDPRYRARLELFRDRHERLVAERAASGHRSLMHLLSAGWLDRCVNRGDLVHYALRYLEWESRYPAEWCKSWGIKRQLLWQLARGPMCARHRVMAANVVVLAASRTQRCEDDRYVLLARAVDGNDDDADLRHRLAAVANDRARFLLYALDHREVGPTPYSWQRWLAPALVP